jgi:hypothetical protein
LAIVKLGEIIVVGSVALSLAVLICPPPETEALLVTLLVPTAVPNPTLTLKLNTLVPDTAIAVELVQVMTCGDAALELQLQLAAFVPPGVTLPAVPLLTVKPVGNVSETVIAPLVAEPPPFVTVKEYVPVEPTVKLPEWLLARVKSDGAMVGVASVVELFPLLAVASPPPETLALLVTLAAAFEATLTLKLKTLEPLVAIAVELVQVITLLAAVQLQLAAFVPLKVTAPSAILKPVGKVSVTVIVPVVADVPLLPIVRL